MKKKHLLKYLAGMILFGTNGIVASGSALSSVELVYMRSIIGAALLAVLYFATGHRVTAHKHPKDLIFVALSGASMGLDWLFLFEAFRQIGVSLAVLINYLGPAIVILLSPLLFREKLGAAKLLAFAAAIIGVFMLSGQAVVSGINIWGLTCALLSSFGSAGLILFNKLSVHVKGMENAMFQLLFAAITVAVFMGISQGFIIDILPADWIKVLWLGILNTGVACYLTFSEITYLPAQTSAICAYIEPVSAVFMSLIFLHESMGIFQIIGAILVIGGAAFTEIMNTKETTFSGNS